MSESDTIFVSSSLLGEPMQGTRKQFEVALKDIMKAWYEAYLASGAGEPIMSLEEYSEFELNGELVPAERYSEEELAKIPSL